MLISIPVMTIQTSEINKITFWNQYFLLLFQTRSVILTILASIKFWESNKVKKKKVLSSLTPQENIRQKVQVMMTYLTCHNSIRLVNSIVLSCRLFSNLKVWEIIWFISLMIFSQGFVVTKIKIDLLKMCKILTQIISLILQIKKEYLLAPSTF